MKYAQTQKLIYYLQVAFESFLIHGSLTTKVEAKVIHESLVHRELPIKDFQMTQSI